ncbi:MAG: hypothetical protein KQH57_05240 [Actinomycetales bacterium]|nr:hypothetical protein [Actinomycetales bacterium]
MTDVGDIAALLAAFGFGSLGAAAIGRAREQRGARARVLGALHEVERRRWYDPDGEPFVAAVMELQAAALVARVPRRLVENYIVAARVAYGLSHDNWEERGGDDEFAAGIASDVANVARMMSRVVADAIWRPWWGRIGARRHLRRMEAAVAALPARYAQRFASIRQYG